MYTTDINREKRYNTFNIIHKALRRLLYDTAIDIQRTDFDGPQAEQVIEKVKLVTELFENHAHHEDTFILPHVIHHNNLLVKEFEDDHVIDNKLGEDLAASIAAWYKANSAAEKIAIGNNIFYAFNEFIAFNLYHMNKEENALIYTLWKHYTDAEIKQMQMEIVRSISKETLMTESRLMIRALSNSELIGWFNEVKQNAPTEVLHSFLKMATEELPLERMFIIHETLGSDASYA